MYPRCPNKFVSHLCGCCGGAVSLMMLVFFTVASVILSPESLSPFLSQSNKLLLIYERKGSGCFKKCHCCCSTVVTGIKEPTVFL